MPQDLKTHEEIVKNKQAEMTKEAEEKKAAEARDAAKGTPPETEKTKGEEDKAKAEEAVKKAEAQAKEDERILSAEEKDLSEDDKTRKDELLKIKEKHDKSPEEEAKRRQEKIDKRMGELTGEIKDLKKSKDADTAELKGRIEKLEKEKAELEKKLSPPEDSGKKAEEERNLKYIEEDKGKSRHLRREMSKAEMEDWALEDMVGFQEWLAERTVRRSDERKAFKKEQTQDVFTKQQQESYKKVLVEHPEMDMKKMYTRGSELEKEGKSRMEVGKILHEEFPMATLSLAIADEHPEWSKLPNGPELVVEEVLKRKKKEASKKDTDEEDKKKAEEDRKAKEAEDLKKKEEKASEIEDAKEEERQRQARIDSGLSSDISSKTEDEKSKDPKYQKMLKIFKSKGLGKKELDAHLKRRAGIPGAS